MKIIEGEQRTTRWYEARKARPTASAFDKIITTKGEPSKSAKKYMYQLAGEFVSGVTLESFQSEAMTRGIELEAEAREFYELTHSVEVRQVAFCLTDNNLSGCSPDGLVGEDGMIEIKCPLVQTHVEYMLNNKLPTAYFQQVQGQLWVTDRKWCDFISYYPGLKPLIVRVVRDEVFITLLENEIEKFCIELKNIIKKIGE